MTLVVGLSEVAGRLGKTRGEAARLHARGAMSPPDWLVDGGPAWRWSTIERWALATNRPLRIVPRKRRSA
ncbi:MAG: hypothetical protein M3Q48_14710 [Actinomycetota bacterium]|nr:hypothetical protein [Actinomycetota bacterium]